MRKFVVSVFDSAVQAYANPVFVPAKGVAVRSFGDEVNRVDINNPLNKHSSDFELRCLAIFDEETGLFHPLSDGVVEVLARGKDLKEAA